MKKMKLGLSALGFMTIITGMQVRAEDVQQDESQKQTQKVDKNQIKPLTVGPADLFFMGMAACAMLCIIIKLAFDTNELKLASDTNEYNFSCKVANSINSLENWRISEAVAKLIKSDSGVQRAIQEVAQK